MQCFSHARRITKLSSSFAGVQASAAVFSSRRLLLLLLVVVVMMTMLVIEKTIKS